MKLSQKTVILTGAASGIGAALLIELSKIDCFLAAVDMNAQSLADTCAAITNPKAKIIQIICDISNPGQVDGLIKTVQAQFGKIDLFIANAGFAYYEKLDEANWEHIEKIFSVNTISPIYSLLKLKAENKNHPFRVVLVASAMAKLGLPGYALYSASKASLVHFIEAYRWEGGSRSDLCVVYPIATKTRFFHHTGEKSAPIPWPSQSAETVARKIIRGIKNDKHSIYPSLVFWFFYQLGRFFPPLYTLEQWIEKRNFDRWLEKV